MSQLIKGTLYNAFTGERVPDCEPWAGRVCIYRVSIWQLAPTVDGDCWNKMLIPPYCSRQSIPFYSAEWDLSDPTYPYCYPCAYHLYAYADVKLGDNWIRYGTGVKTIYVEDDCDITEDFYIPVSVPAPPGCDKLFVSNYGTVMSEIKEEELEKGEMVIHEEGETKRFILS